MSDPFPRRFLFAVAFLLPIFCSSTVFAESGSLATKYSNRLRAIEKQLDDLGKSQSQILAEQEAIIEKIKNLKIWVNRRRGGGAAP